eukprot:NODE_8_length_66115_cov_0.981823.p3 type:complete len:827 gc:universal NODE_8_length_66115_cov_0.981823:24198-26678(+)
MSFQLRALTRKQLIQEKRRWKTSLCCVGLCPFLMVLIAGGVGIFLQQLLASQLKYQETLVCSNSNATDSNGLYTQAGVTLDKSKVYGATIDVIATNYYTAPFKFSKNGPPTGGSQSSCVRWHTQNTPDQFPYSRQTNQSTWLAGGDTLFIPAPAGGWLNVQKFANQTYAFKLTQLQTYPWWIVSGDDQAKLGSRGSRQYSFTNVSDFTATNPPSRNDASGIFKTMGEQVYINVDTTNKTNPFSYYGVPFAKTSSGSVSEVDDAFQAIIADVLDKISRVVDKPDSPTFQSDRSIADRIKIQTSANKIVQSLPWGTMIVNSFIPNSVVDMVLQVGHDTRIDQAAQYTSLGLRRFMSWAYVAQGALKQIDNSADLNHGIRNFPQLVNNKIDFNFDSFLADILFPFALSFLFPIFVVTLVREKEDRIAIMMKMNGLKTSTYYFTHAITFFILHVLACVVFTVTGIAFRLKFFVNTDPGVYILLFLFWGLVQIAMAFFFATIFDKSRLSLIVSFFTVLVNIIISLALDRLQVNGYNTFFFIWPPFAFYRALSLINAGSYDSDLTPYTLANANPPDNVGLALIALSLETIAYIFMAYYASQVLPSEFGTQKPWYFPFEYLKNKMKKNSTTEEGTYTAIEIDDKELTQEDNDVKNERARIDKGEYDPECPLIVKHMRKVYPNGKLAVRDVTFAVEKNSIMGLLGPNGAGKSTLISILTGLYPPSHGQAKLGGFDIHTEQDKVFQVTGICPQHDILWPDLTVEEHLYFYARLKGVPPAKEKEAVTTAIESVKLAAFTKRQSGGLSGGEKRRLSIAISLIGDPRIIFLDEPTTGI